MLLRQIVDDSLSQYAYLVGCQATGEALIIDPERDVDRYVAAAAAEGLRVTAAAETHIHADFLSGARELAARGVTAFLSKAGDADWQYAWPARDRADVRLLGDGDTFQVGRIEVRAIHTPGHTPEHLSFLVTDRGAGADEPLGIASGDFVFVGDVGRPDLLESAAGVAGAMRPSAARLGESLRTFAGLPDGLLIWPGHGAGSACGKALGAVPISSVGYERRFNAALRLAVDEPDRFVDVVLDGQPEPPLYFATMKRVNQEGPPILGALPAPPALSSEALAARLSQPGLVVLDTRLSRRAFMARHLRGALYCPLDRQFSTIAGSFVRPDDRLVLIVDAAKCETAVRQLVRIGFDAIEGYATPDVADTLLDCDGTGREGGAFCKSTPATTFAGLADARRNGLVLDVRSASEHHAGHLPGSLHIPHTRLMAHLAELPRDRTLFVHCASGARAAAAAAALDRLGFDVVHVDGAYAPTEA